MTRRRPRATTCASSCATASRVTGTASDSRWAMGSSFREPMKRAGLVLAVLAMGSVARGADRAPADNGGAPSNASSPSGPSPAPGTYTGPDTTAPPSSPGPKAGRPRAADADTDDTDNDTDTEAPKRNVRK